MLTEQLQIMTRESPHVFGMKQENKTDIQTKRKYDVSLNEDSRLIINMIIRVSYLVERNNMHWKLSKEDGQDDKYFCINVFHILLCSCFMNNVMTTKHMKHGNMR